MIRMHFVQKVPQLEMLGNRTGSRGESEHDKFALCSALGVCWCLLLKAEPWARGSSALALYSRSCALNVPVLGSQQMIYPAHLWLWLYPQHLFRLRQAEVTWAVELPCNTWVCYKISLAVVKLKAWLYMKQISGRGKELWGPVEKALSTTEHLTKIIHHLCYQLC